MNTVQRIFLIVFLAGGLSACAIGSLTGEGDNRQIRETGVAATATVLEVWDTGVSLNDDPVVGFRLEVTLDDSVYEATTKNVISIVHIPQVQPGAVLPVKVDPVDRSRVALDIYKER